MRRALFFDMDGVVFNSMPVHAQAWEVVMQKYGLPFTARDCYIQEGRTGQSVIDECFLKVHGRHAEEAEWRSIYKEKTEWFYAHGPVGLIPGVRELLYYLHDHPSRPLIYLVTGSGQHTLFDELEAVLPGVFTRERMVTAFDYVHGKPDPEPYLMAYGKASAVQPLRKEECLVVENAPLGVQSGKAAGLPVAAVNTGVLTEDDLRGAGADYVFADMPSLLNQLKADVL